MDTIKVNQDIPIKFSQFVISNLVISLFFIVFKLIILVITASSNPFFPGYYFFDLLVAGCLSSFILLNKNLFHILTDILINFYIANIVYLFFFDCYIDKVTFIFLSEGFTNFFDSLMKEFNLFMLLIPVVDISLKRFSINFFCKKIQSRIYINSLLIVSGVLFVITAVSYLFIPNNTLNYQQYNRNPYLTFLASLVKPAKIKELQATFSTAETKAAGAIRFDTHSPYPRETSEQKLYIAPLPEQPLNIVLILLESTGVKPTAALSNKIMPNFWQLAKHGIYWKNFYAVVPSSIKTIFSVHSGYYPLPVMEPCAYFNIRVPAKALPLYFKDRSYRTILLHGGHFSYSDKLKYLNTCGYDTLLDAESLPDKKKYESTSWGIDDKALFDYAKNWIRQDKQPFFITFIPIHPHHPYLPPAHWPNQFPTKNKLDRYFNAIQYEDYLLGDFVNFLKEQKLFDSTLFILLGDHGEAFGLHKRNEIHSSDIYEENVQVPLLIANPLLFPYPQQSQSIGTMPDLLPTVLDILKIEKEQEEQPGVSLLKAPAARMVFFYSGQGSDKLGLRDNNFKFIYRRELNYVQLFDLTSDPDERNNLAAHYPERTTYYKQKVTEWEKYTASILLNNNLHSFYLH